jgi:hypothetical protein
VHERLGIPRWAWIAIQAVWFLTALGFAAYRTEHEDRADATVLAYLVLAFAIFLVPIVQKITIAGSTLELNPEKAKIVTETRASIEVVSDTIVSKSHLLTRSWTDILLRTAALSQMDCTQAERSNFVIEECRRIIKEAAQWLADDPGEGVRLTLWMLEDDGDLGFVVGNVDESQRLIFAEDFFTTTDDDYIGQAWREQRVINEADAPEDWRAYNKSGEAAFFSGIMFVPVRWRGQPWGLLEVDRESAQRFSRDAEVVATAAANAMTLLIAGHGVKAPPPPPDDDGMGPEAGSTGDGAPPSEDGGQAPTAPAAAPV